MTHFRITDSDGETSCWHANGNLTPWDARVVANATIKEHNLDIRVNCVTKVEGCQNKKHKGFMNPAPIRGWTFHGC